MCNGALEAKQRRQQWVQVDGVQITRQQPVPPPHVAPKLPRLQYLGRGRGRSSGIPTLRTARTQPVLTRQVDQQSYSSYFNTAQTRCD